MGFEQPGRNETENSSIKKNKSTGVVYSNCPFVVTT